MNSSTSTKNLSKTSKVILILLMIFILLGNFLRDSQNTTVVLIGEILPVASLGLAIVLAFMQRIKLLYIIVYLIIAASLLAYPFVFKN